jgi:predicted RNA-binding Zn-ribbon protein involved in translation (DUF1610 family)
MTIFENVGKKVSEVVEVTKLNSAINGEEDKIKKLYIEIGRKVYESFIAGRTVSSDLLDECNAIKACNEAIEDFRSKILQVKNLKKCDKCGEELEMKVLFCPKCGEKQPPIEIKGEKPQNQGLVCFGCGAPIKPETKFCPKCGAKQEERPEETEEEQVEAQVKVCPTCGVQLEEGIKFCQNCGTKIEE